jgi:hypothetical protein
MASGLLCFFLQKYCWKITCAVSLGPTLNLNIWMCTASALENAEGGCRALFSQSLEATVGCFWDGSTLHCLKSKIRPGTVYVYGKWTEQDKVPEVRGTLDPPSKR